LFSETADATFAGRMADLPKPPQCFTGRITLSSVLRPPWPVKSSLACGIASIFHQASYSTGPSSVFYLSGPPVMLKSLAADLRARGAPSESIRTDAWE
jgi:hypothetical protein